MKLTDQRDTLRDQSKETEERLAQFVHWLRTSNKFKGADAENVVYGNDWIRVGEVWPFLQELQRDLREIRHETLSDYEYQLEMDF